MPDQNYSEPSLENDTDHELLFKAAYAQWLIEQGGGGGGSGTVTSVGLSLPSIFTVSGSPVTTTGTLTGELATQAANTVFAGPSTGAAATPTFRALVNADVPSPGNTGNVLFTEAGLMTAVDDMNYDSATGEFQLGGFSVPGSIFLKTAGGLQPEVHFQNINLGVTTLQPGTSAGSFTSTLPSSDGLLINENGTNTLTNKTISGASNTLSNIALSSLASQSASTLVGRTSASAGSPTEITLGSGLSMSGTELSTSGTMILLASVTASSSATVEFTSGLTSTYRRYQVLIDGLSPATDSTDFQMRLSNDGGSTWLSTGNYSATLESDSLGFAPDYREYTSQTSIPITSPQPFYRMSSTSGENGFFTINFSDPSTSRAALVNWNGSYMADDAGTTPFVNCNGAGLWTGAQIAISGIQFLFASGNIAAGRFRLYGIP